MLLRYMQTTSETGTPPKLLSPKQWAKDSPLGLLDAGQNVPAHDTVTAVYRLARRGEAARFTPLPNRRLLWHGSRRSNLIGILSQGLRVAPPEAPVSGYMFGRGVYFADMFCKSRQYCASGSKKEPAYMLLCDVALGNLYPCRRANPMDEPQPGTSATWGVGSKGPDWQSTVTEPGGAALPAGPLSEAAGGRGNYNLNYNEFIVYDPAQVRMRYLVELNNFECPGETQARKAKEAAHAAMEAEAAAAKRARRF